ncbi:MAG: sigma 54-interacting transcriptional regulator [Candidatus Zixiibacteriota bacterium]
MSLTSHQNLDFDNRLLEIEEQYRLRKPDIAGEKLKALETSGYAPEGYELGLYKSLKAQALFNDGKYKDAMKFAQEASRMLASSAFHQRIGNNLFLLHKIYIAIGDTKSAERYAHDAYAFYRQADFRSGMVDALNGLGQLAFIRCDFQQATDYVIEAVDLSRGDNVRMARLIGNLGRIEILNGNWVSAENNLKTALRLADELSLPISKARNHLSLGYLHIRQRQFNTASRELKSAQIIIDKEDFKRERVILAEYSGELAFEMGDLVQAKRILHDAHNMGRELAPESTLVTQVTRRLAQIEYSLDNLDEALKFAQKSFDLSVKVGEKTEIGLSQMVMAEVFCARGNYNAAYEYAMNGLELLRKVADPYDVARSLLVQADIFIHSGDVNRNIIDKTFEEAFRIFNSLKIFYWSAETRFRQGTFWCQQGNISSGFKNLHEAEKIFETIAEKTRIRSIRVFLQELSRHAVERSLTIDNEFKIFGNYFTDREYLDLKSGKLQEIIGILSKRTGAGRVVVHNFGPDGGDLFSNINLSDHQKKKFIQQFTELLGEEFSKDRPTLILDSRRDPFINELLQPEKGKVVASVIVTPLLRGGEIAGYVYLDRESSNGNLAPFGQRELNFVVGFADLIALKMAEYERYLLEEDNKRLKAQLLERSAFPNIITQNKEMLEMLARIQQVVNSDISILIEGETGSGKDLLAKTIHYNSERRDKKFISVNCAALPETLLESELFGHRKGAFTGADRDKTGLFEEADGGTFFLDEIGDMPLSIQAKVLRILEEKEIVRLGETRPIKVDVRILSATNKDLKSEMEAGRFRQDLYYRLTALCFKIPPLRERREDIPLLIKHFAGDNHRFSPEALRMMVAFDWPGNIRELENEVKKLTLLSGESGIIDLPLLSGKIISAQKGEARDGFELNTDVSFNDRFTLYDYLAEYEKRFILKALREQGGIKKHAASILNIPESTLRLKIKQYNINLENLGAA